MNSLFLILSLVSLFSLQASENPQSPSGHSLDFNVVKFIQPLGEGEGEIIMTITNHEDRTIELIEVPTDFFESIQLEKLNQEELEIKVAQLQEEVADKQKVLEHYREYLKQEPDNLVGQPPIPPPLPSSLAPKHIDLRGVMFKELREIHCKKLKPIEYPHPAQAAYEEDDTIDLQEALRRALVQKFSKALPEKSDEQISVSSESE